MTDATVSPSAPVPPATPIVTPPAAEPAAIGAPANTPAATTPMTRVAQRRLKPFSPLKPPPTDGHTLNSGLSTELGDSAKTMMMKVNAGFEHVYSLLTGTTTGQELQVPTAAAPTPAPVQVSTDGSHAAVANTSFLSSIESRVKSLESSTSEMAVDDFDKMKQDINNVATKLAAFVPIEEFTALQTQFNALKAKVESFFNSIPTAAPPASVPVPVPSTLAPAPAPATVAPPAPAVAISPSAPLPSTPIVAPATASTAAK